MTTVGRNVVIHPPRLTATVLTALLVGLLAACGDSSDSDGSAASDPRTVDIDMVDIAFEPERLEVDEGETVRFVFTNRGEVAHDAFVGDADAQADHERGMRAEEDEGDHGGGHDDADDDAVTLEPGESEELTYTFDEAGSIEIGCHQAGHYDAGMTITVDVT